MSDVTPAAAVAVRAPSLAADLVTLTKPRIISLLLVTHSPEVSKQFDREVKLEEVNRATAQVAKK